MTRPGAPIFALVKPVQYSAVDSARPLRASALGNWEGSTLLVVELNTPTTTSEAANTMKSGRGRRVLIVILRVARGGGVSSSREDPPEAQPHEQPHHQRERREHRVERQALHHEPTVHRHDDGRRAADVDAHLIDRRPGRTLQTNCREAIEIEPKGTGRCEARLHPRAGIDRAG